MSQPTPSRGMTVTFHGVRGSTPCHGHETHHYGGNTSCVSVCTANDVPVVFDLGTGVRYFGKQCNGTTPLRIVCLLTHLHYDHTLGLPFFEPLLRSETTLEIYAPKQPDGRTIRELFLEKIKPPMFPVPLEQFAARIEFHEIGDDDFTIGNYSVRSRFVPHIGPTLGFRLGYDGASVTYLSDHQQPVGDTFSIGDGARELCEEGDLLIHDSQFTDEEFAMKQSWGHSTYAYARWVAETCRAKQLALFHHDPSRTDEMLTKLTDQIACSTKIGVFAAREGQSVLVGA
ncbi:MAG: MBL fold metallo-hydrolase [Actinomycetota bacterium]